MDLYPQFDIQNVARAVYGDGIDGVGAFDGVSAVAGFGLVGSVYTQTRDVTAPSKRSAEMAALLLASAETAAAAAVVVVVS